MGFTCFLFLFFNPINTAGALHTIQQKLWYLSSLRSILSQSIQDIMKINKKKIFKIIENQQIRNRTDYNYSCFIM